jgi:hypothetical protein
VLTAFLRDVGVIPDFTGLGVGAGFEPIPSRGGIVTNASIDQIRDDDGL